jgi:hypothetical protein
VQLLFNVHIKIILLVLPGREGKGKNEPLRKLVISLPIKSGKEIPFGFG